MIKNYLLAFVFILGAVAAQAQLEGTTWKMAPMANALAVGPNQGDGSWWSNDDQAVTDRACFFDDLYVFNADGTFENQLGADTWLEGWQGATPDACGAAPAPHDGSASATWAYDATAGTVTITGTGAYLGLSKVHNTGELAAPADAVASITYTVTTLSDSTMTLDINYGPSASEGWWRFEMVLESSTSTDIVKNEGAFNVFPNPATDQFTINFEEAFSTSANLSVYDFQGKLVKQEILNNQQTVIATDDLKTGLYIIRVDSEEKSYVHKLSIVK